MTALCLLGAGLCILSFLIIFRRPMTRSIPLGLLLLALAVMALLLTAPVAETVNRVLGPLADGVVGDIVFILALLFAMIWLDERSMRPCIAAFCVTAPLLLILCVLGQRAGVDASDRFAFGHSLYGTGYALLYVSWMFAGGVLLLRQRASANPVARVSVGLLRTAGVLSAGYAPLRLLASFAPSDWAWKGGFLRAIAGLGIVFFALAVIVCSTASYLHSRRMMNRVDALVTERFGGRSPTGAEERLFLRGPLGRTADTIVNAADHYPASFPSLGGPDGVPLRRLLIFLGAYK